MVVFGDTALKSWSNTSNTITALKEVANKSGASDAVTVLHVREVTPAVLFLKIEVYLRKVTTNVFSDWLH